MRRLFQCTLAACGLLLAAPGGRPAPTNTPPGQATPPNPARSRVVAVHDESATTNFEPRASVVRRMVDDGLIGLTGKATPAAAWRSVVAPTDVVGFKVCSAPGALSGSRPAVVAALVESLLAAGQAPERIIIWDKREVDLILAGWPALASRLGVRCRAAADAGWDETRSYESSTIGRLVAGDLEFGRAENNRTGRRSYVSRLVSRELTRIITVAPVLNHNQLGVNGHLANLALGSVDNTLRFEHDAARLAEAVPEICALDELLPRVAFGVTDALICQYRGEERTLLHYAIPGNELRFGTDLVSLDVLALLDIEAARRANPTDGEKPARTDLYLNAELIELGVAQTNRIERVRHP